MTIQVSTEPSTITASPAISRPPCACTLKRSAWAASKLTPMAAPISKAAGKRKATGDLRRRTGEERRRKKNLETESTPSGVRKYWFITSQMS